MDLAARAGHLRTFRSPVNQSLRDGPEGYADRHADTRTRRPGGEDSARRREGAKRRGRREEERREGKGRGDESSKFKV
jgi:hypothetical protein